MIITPNVEQKFEAMGARFRVRNDSFFSTSRNEVNFAVDVTKDDTGESFEFRAPRNNTLEVTVSDVQPDKRHLLMFVRDTRKTGKKEEIDRFLCGHDERAWFVAAVPGTSSTVTQAMIALQPKVVQDAAHKARLTWEQRLQRHNKAFHRQGEWFFVPQPDMQVDRKKILKDEPIQRGNRSKPHIIEELYREGGETVWVEPHLLNGGNGVSLTEKEKIVAKDPKAASWNWRQMVRNPTSYARGAVKHADHDTLILHCWHLIAMNTETQSRTMRNVAFLD